MSESHPAPGGAAVVDPRRKIRRALVGALVAAIATIVLFSLFGDLGEIRTAIRGFDTRVIPLVIALTIWNYIWRAIKFRWFTAELGVPSAGVRLDTLIFLSGMALTITPGKVGELIRTVYIRRLTGAPPNRTSAAIIADRITDGLAMLALAMAGLFEFRYGRPFLALVLVALAGGLILIQRPELLHRIINRFAGMRIVGGGVVHARAFIDATHTLFRPRMLAKGFGISLFSWYGECIAFFLILVGLGLDASWSLLLAATFILAVSSLAGGASMLPGGLGIADATVAGMLLLLIDDPEMNRSLAAAATLLVRFATLWLGVVIGAVALGILERETRGLAHIPDLTEHEVANGSPIIQKGP
jgi:uncharacterized membrane protein YbhN (UPF0104 family)